MAACLPAAQSAPVLAGSTSDSATPDTTPDGCAKSIRGDASCSPATSLACRAIPISPALIPSSLSELTCSSEARPVRTSATRGSGKDLMGTGPSCSTTTSASGTPSTSNGASGRTSRVPCPPTLVWTSHRSWAPSWAQPSMFPAADGRAQVWLPDPMEASSGDCSTLNTSECPNDVAVCSLSDILEAHVHPRFYLSPRAARGILRRAAKRGRELPRHLREALADLASVSQDDDKRMISTSSRPRSRPAASVVADAPTLKPPTSSERSTPNGAAPTTTAHRLFDPVDSMPAKTEPGEERPLSFAENQRHELLENDTVGSLSKGGGKPGRGYPAIREGSTVRRLTPTECERLMGWPDAWTVLSRAASTTTTCA